MFLSRFNRWKNLPSSVVAITVATLSLAAVRAEETVCFINDSNFLAECGMCPPGSQHVSGPNKPKPGCKVKEYKDPRLIDHDQAVERMKASHGAASRRNVNSPLDEDYLLMMRVQRAASAPKK